MSSCAVCGHPDALHNGRDTACRWEQNPDSPTASLFCKCPRFVDERTPDAQPLRRRHG